MGAAGGLLVGLIFPPAFLASGVVGAGIGAGVGGLVSRSEKTEIKAEVADDLSAEQFQDRGVVRGAVGERRGREPLKGADDVSKHEVDKHGVEQAKDATAGATA